MPFVPVVQTALIELIYTLDGQRVENTLYFLGEDPWTETLLSELAEDVVTWFDLSGIQTYMSNQVALVQIVATDLENQFGARVDYAIGLPLSGVNASPAMPNNVSITISFRTGLRGRGNRGRNYFVGLCEAECVANQVSIAARNNFIAAYNTLPTYVLENNAHHVVVSRIFEGAPRPSGVTHLVTQYLCESYIDSQRRRLPGRGN
jgi:hypothetical protein